MKYDKAHGVLMGTTVCLLFPLGAVYMRLGGSAWAHGAIQTLSLAFLIAGFGVGYKLAQFRGYVSQLFSPCSFHVPLSPSRLPHQQEEVYLDLES